MMNTLVGLVVAMSPLLAVVGLLALAARRDRVREAAVARQIRLTDAIAAELGAVVAPVVRKRRGGPWQIEMGVPLARPATVARILSIVDGVMPGRYEIVLTRQQPAARPEREWVVVRRHLRVAWGGARCSVISS